MCGYRRFLFLIFVLFTLTSCGHDSPEGFREEGEAITKSLVKELRNIHTEKQLSDASGSIRSHFDRLVDVMIAGEEFYSRHPKGERDGFHAASRELSDRLRFELNRLYRLDRGRQMIEKSRERALYRLDAYLKQAGEKNRDGRIDRAERFTRMY